MTNLIIQYKHGIGKHFEIIKYPDSQQNVQLDMEYFNNCKIPVVIRCNIRSFYELEVLLALVAALRKADYYIQEIEFIYLLGMRADRAFNNGQPNYFRDVLAPIINSLNVSSIDFLAPHSMLALNAIKKPGIMPTPLGYELSTYTVIGADESAQHDELMFWQHCSMGYHFIKQRDNNEIIITYPKKTYDYILKSDPNRPILIYDDLCDGGATFIKIAELLQKDFPDRKRYLFVVHGLFTKGIEHVAAHFDKVITTNSYQEFAERPKLEVIDVWS